MSLIDLAIHYAGIEYGEYQQILPYIESCDRYQLDAVRTAIGEKKTKKLVESFGHVHILLEKLERENIKYFSCSDSDFPQFLLEMPNPCYLLYYRGNIALLKEFSIGMIGSRRPTMYGRYVASKFSSELSKKGVVIVSGFAQGIDSVCHKGATESKGKTIAVLGTAINNIYPRSNEKYAKEIIESGNLIVSEFPPDSHTLPYHFVQRNRLISGLSEGLLVVEAGEKSGTLTTVDFALEQGKTVFAVPGNINSDNSIGTNRLIRMGAKLVMELDDIFEEFPGIELKTKSQDQSLPDLSEEEQLVYDALKANGAMTNEEISIFTNRNIKYIMGVLSVLEIKDIVKDLGDNRYTLI